MSAATAQSTEALASPPSRQLASSAELSAVSPAPSPARPPRAAPVPLPPPPINWKSTITTRPTSPMPPPPTAMPRPPPRRPPPPRRSRTLDVSTLAFSRYLMLGGPPVAYVYRAPGDGRRRSFPRFARSEPCHRPGRAHSDPVASSSRSRARRGAWRRPRVGGNRPGRKQVMAVSNRVRAALTTTVLATAATGYLAGCSVGGEDDQVAYCTDKDGKIVDDKYCDDGYHGPGAGLFFLYLGGFRSGLPLGTVLPRGGTRILPTDTAARRAAGLAATGAVKAGTRVSGGLGSGIRGGGGVRGGWWPRRRRRRPGRNRRGQLSVPLPAAGARERGPE